MPATRRATPTYAELAARVAELERKLGQCFSVEEMDALRERLVERAERAERRLDRMTALRDDDDAPTQVVPITSSPRRVPPPMPARVARPAVARMK